MFNLALRLSTPEVVLRDPIRPTVDEVSAILRARAKGDLGYDFGVFNDETSPTAGQVELLIDQALQHVHARVGAVIDPAFYAGARNCATMRTCLLIEMSNTPEQTNDGRSVYQSIRLDLRDALEELSANVNVAAMFGAISSDDET